MPIRDYVVLNVAVLDVEDHQQLKQGRGETIGNEEGRDAGTGLLRFSLNRTKVLISLNQRLQGIRLRTMIITHRLLHPQFK